MGFVTLISWCHHTFNLWWGCVEVSPACDFCYARELAKPYGYGVWGAIADHRFFNEKHWEEPLKWNRKHEKEGTRGRVFCMSMGDWGEERADGVGKKMDEERRRLWTLIDTTPFLDWLLLTKRGQAFRRLVPPDILSLPNVWPGVTVESPDYLWRLDALMDIKCAGPRWVSYEPALSPVDFRPYLTQGLGWVIFGGESGPRRRPCALGWLWQTIEHCREAGVPVFVKQDSALRSGVQGRIPDNLWIKEFPQ